MRCTVVTASRAPVLAGGLMYESGDGVVVPGSLVRIPLRNAIVDGIVVATNVELPAREDQGFTLHTIAEVVGNRSILPAPHVELLRWMARTYRCSLRFALSAFIGSPPWRNLLPSPRSTITLASADHATVKGAAKQRAILFLTTNGPTARDVLLARAHVTNTTLNTLIADGIIRETKEENDEPEPLTIERPILSDIQGKAVDQIRMDARPALLFGVTGSGKTEIYADLIADALAPGGQALVLLPEILLTEHLVGRFARLLPSEKIAVLHSKLSSGERRRTWRAIASGEIRLVIGSRSALFAPLVHLKLIVIDEEHEWTYKNEQTPRYVTRDAAQVLAKAAGARLVLGSATPSLEAWHAATNGVFNLVHLPVRYGGQSMPTVRIVDLATSDCGDTYPLTPSLREAIGDRLQRREQSILFLNRRGSATAVLCLDCRTRLLSPDSNLPFAVHRGSDGRPFLLDHTTNRRADLPVKCPHCGSARLYEIGAGTQRVEEFLRKIFPTARILRADRDTMATAEDIRSLLRTMENGEADILLGTQSVVKGLDLSRVTLAAVLLADTGLSLPHFRAGERVFQLLMQLTGRSGRAKPGEVIVQTYRPDALEVQAASKHDTEGYLMQESRIRSALGYPPNTRMIRFLFDGPDARTRAEATVCLLMDASGKDLVTRASAAPTYMGAGRTWHVLARTQDPATLLDRIDPKALYAVTVDIDPVDCL
jgi:primosomal protein N' (replication factor Y)